MIWKTSAAYKLPAPPPAIPMADWCVYQSIKQNLDGADDYFVFPAGQPKMGAMYADPAAYIKGLVAMYENFKQYLPSSDADPMFLVVMAVMGPGGCFDMLKQMAVAPNDPDSVSVYQAWTAGTGGLPGGHAPIPAAVGDGVNGGTGQSAAPPNSIL